MKTDQMVHGQRYTRVHHFSIPREQHTHEQELHQGKVFWYHTHEDGNVAHRHGVSLQITAEILFENDDPVTDKVDDDESS